MGIFALLFCFAAVLTHGAGASRPCGMNSTSDPMLVINSHSAYGKALEYLFASLHSVVRMRVQSGYGHHFAANAACALCTASLLRSKQSLIFGFFSASRAAYRGLWTGAA